VAGKHAFLSNKWIRAARAIYAGCAEPTAPAASVRANLVVEGVPFGEGTVLAHLDTSAGFIDIDLGHLAGPELTVHLDYALAKSVLLDGDIQTGLEAFLAGRVRVEGDVTRLLALQQTQPSPRQLELAEEIRAITS